MGKPSRKLRQTGHGLRSLSLSGARVDEKRESRTGGLMIPYSGRGIYQTSILMHAVVVNGGHQAEVVYFGRGSIRKTI